jgi:hypothetical protein
MNMKNIGSIQKIEIVLQEDVESISRPDSNGEVSIILVSDKSWDDFYFTNYTASFIEKEKEHKAGNYYEQTIICKAPKVSTETRVNVEKYNNRKLVLKITDGNGTQFLVGNKQIPVSQIKTLVRPAETSGYNGYDITFYSKNTRPAPIITDGSQGGGEI